MSHNQQVLSHIKRYGSITPRKALDSYGCFRLAARIYELRLKGHEIETILIGERGVDQYAKYRLKAQ